MIDLLLSLLQESPLLFAVLVINITIVSYIAVRLGLYIAYKKKPGKTISHFLWKIKAKKEKVEIKTVEDVYAYIMDGLKKEGALGKQDNYGLISRKKVLNVIPEGEKRQILQEIFLLYESKMYSKGRVVNERKVVSDVLNRYADL
jgi:hypothetical protein